MICITPQGCIHIFTLPLPPLRCLHGELYSLTPEGDTASGVDEVGGGGGDGTADVQHILFEINLSVDMRIADEVNDPLFALLICEVERL